MSSHQTVVSTTLKSEMRWNRDRSSAHIILRLLSSQREGGDGSRTSRCKLGVHTLAHDTLQTHARTNQPQTRVCARVGPRGLSASGSDAALPALPERDGAGHCEESLNNGAEEQPQARGGADAITDTAKKGAEDKSGQGCEGLLVGEVERSVTMTWRALKEAREGKRKLYSFFLCSPKAKREKKKRHGHERLSRKEREDDYLHRVTSLECAPDKDGGEGHRVAM
jgi:hypothetical protein